MSELMSEQKENQLTNEEWRAEWGTMPIENPSKLEELLDLAPVGSKVETKGIVWTRQETLKWRPPEGPRAISVDCEQLVHMFVSDVSQVRPL
jgi:hypothetical protein